MRYSKLFAPTLREVPSDVELLGHGLLLRAGFIRQEVAGVYEFLPLGWRTLNKVSDIIRDEMDKAGAQELLLPAISAKELWAESGREATMHDVLLGFKDRRGTEYYLGPTHEEVITDLVRRNVQSYRDLPINLYQIQMKFRDEPRPRGGLVRAREFLMKDAYSFNRNEEELDVTYNEMYEAYLSIFKRCGLNVTPVHASGGAIGGKETMEFMLLTDAGEDSILTCPSCGQASNQEIADYRLVVATPAEPARAKTRVETPGAHTIEELSEFLHQPAERMVKTLILMADDKPVAALIRGDRELNEGRFRVQLGAARLEMATPEQIQEATGGPIGFSGPVGLKIPIFADEELRGMVNFITGANEADAHLVDVNWTDVTHHITWSRLRFAVAGDICDVCGTPFEEKRGMELGHIFKLRYAISEPLHAVYTDENGEEKTIIMGCYGIGVSRILAAVAQVSNDANGLIWPTEIAPYQVHLVAANVTDDTQRTLAEKIDEELTKAGIDVLYDDREERAGVKFKDADLIGIPIQIVVGRTASEGIVEVRDRATKTAESVQASEITANVQKRIAQSKG
ncbi:MAG TPA: proline--tRNA ligase [Armatimonadota bacterium]